MTLSPALDRGRGGRIAFPYLKDVSVTTFLFYKNLLMNLMGIIINMKFNLHISNPIFNIININLGLLSEDA